MSALNPQGLFALVLAAAAAAQDPKFVAYKERDILSPFRTPTDVYAPPDRLFMLLRRMRSIAEDGSTSKDFDAKGREIVDHEGWRLTFEEVDKLGIDAAYLAQIMRLSKNADDRATAFYAAFFCKQPDMVVNLISHIPGEPERKTREASFPRAIAYLRAHLGRRFGDLSTEEQDAAKLALPAIGSPVAKAAGIVRMPRAEDHLFNLRLIPFFQLLDLDASKDQAQGLWFLKEVFMIRIDMALLWLEPSLPRIRQLLVADAPEVREQAVGLLQTIGPRDLRPASIDEEPQALQAWADVAIRALFPPIRNLNNAIIQLHPSPERDAIVAAGIAALDGDSLGEPSVGKTKDGASYRGFRVRHVPEALKELAIPAGAVITNVQGAPVGDAASVLRTVKQLCKVLQHPRTLLVEYVHNGGSHAVEYRIL